MQGGEVPMTIDINHQKRYIDIWLSRGEASPDLNAYRQKYPGYSIAVFRSGNGDVKRLTAELLKANCNKC